MSHEGSLSREERLVGGYMTQAANVPSLVQHRSYNPSSKYPYKANDIALLKLDSPFKLTSRCAKATLPRDDRHTLTGQRGYVASTSGDDGIKGPLKYANFEVVDASVCRNRLNERSQFSHQYHLCGKSYHDAAACKGDAGAPFFLISGTVIGLGSWYIPPCSTAKPSVFTRISAYLSWMRNIVNDDDDDIFSPDSHGGHPDKLPDS
ncbi:hypothetical protein ACOMHN_052301 [Nucella lapillus]